jgi:hypothetical protein
MRGVARYIVASKNAKIGRHGSVDATYVSPKTCPPSCPLRGRGCYAENAHMGTWFRKMESASKGMSALDVSRAEAMEIDGAYEGKIPPWKVLRLHVMGDCRTAEGATVVASAVARWLRRGGSVAWTYTHAWDRVPAFSWGDISTLASVDRKEDVAKADSRGYAVAIIADRAMEIAGIKFVICPAQHRHSTSTCEECRLCFDADGLRKARKGIVFLPHGSRFKKIDRVR